eukprot:7385496-Prymnesium_polylepis.2
MTSFAVWGRVSSSGGLCIRRSGAMSGTAKADEFHRVAFTACDEDGLPVNHQLPISQSDERRFAAYLNASARGQTLVSTEYGGGGYHDILLAVPTYGAFTVVLELGGVETAR